MIVPGSPNSLDAIWKITIDNTDVQLPAKSLRPSPILMSSRDLNMEKPMPTDRRADKAKRMQQAKMTVNKLLWMQGWRN